MTGALAAARDDHALRAARAQLAALRGARKIAMDQIRPSILALAEYANASTVQFGMSLGTIEEELDELCWAMRTALEERIRDAERAIEQADAV